MTKKKKHVIIAKAWLTGYAIHIGVVIREDENGMQRAWIGPDIRSNVINDDSYRFKKHKEIDDLKQIIKTGAKLDLEAANAIIKAHNGELCNIPIF